jgi:hypothetical protein
MYGNLGVVAACVLVPKAQLACHAFGTEMGPLARTFVWFLFLGPYLGLCRPLGPGNPPVVPSIPGGGNPSPKAGTRYFHLPYSSYGGGCGGRQPPALIFQYFNYNLNS